MALEVDYAVSTIFDHHPDLLIYLLLLTILFFVLGYTCCCLAADFSNNFLKSTGLVLLATAFSLLITTAVSLVVTLNF